MLEDSKILGIAITYKNTEAQNYHQVAAQTQLKNFNKSMLLLQRKA